MKRKDKENLKNMSAAELESRLGDVQKKLFQIKFRRSSAPPENPMEIRHLRRKIAMIKTLLAAKAAAPSAAASEVEAK